MTTRQTAKQRQMRIFVEAMRTAQFYGFSHRRQYPHINKGCGSKKYEETKYPIKTDVKIYMDQ
jgi:hypothetical protein